MEQAHQGRDTTTLDFMMEVIRLLMLGQVEGLEVPTLHLSRPPLSSEPSQPPMPEVV